MDEYLKNKVEKKDAERSAATQQANDRASKANEFADYCQSFMKDLQPFFMSKDPKSEAVNFRFNYSIYQPGNKLAGCEIAINNGSYGLSFRIEGFLEKVTCSLNKTQRSPKKSMLVKNWTLRSADLSNESLEEIWRSLVDAL